MTDATPQPQPVQPQPAGPLSASDDKLWASLAHFGGVLGFLPSLLIFLILKDRGALTRQESKEALNWQITFTAAMIVLNIAINIIVSVVSLAMPYSVATVFALLLGILPFLLWVLNAILSILGGVKVNSGGAYRYPFAIRLIK